MKINKLIKAILLLSGFLYIVYTYQEINALKKEVVFLTNAVLYKENFTSKVINTTLKNKQKSIISIQCQYEKQKWNFSGVIVSKNYILTAKHVFDIEDMLKKNKDVSCSLINSGFFVKKNVKININDLIFVNQRDMVYVKIDNLNFNLKNVIFPKKGLIKKGDPLFLISHPWDFINNQLVTFGLVVSEDITNSLQKEKKALWHKAILSDMSASPGSSGAPIFDIQGNYIGIHVGGIREKGLNLNYQLLFDQQSILIHEHIISVIDR